MRENVEPDLFIFFNARAFVRALSYRDFLTSICLALVVVAMGQVFQYYSSETFFENRTGSLRKILFLLILPLNHIAYKAEHKRSNNFIGRILHDLIFIGAFWVINEIMTVNIKAIFAGDPLTFILFLIVLIILLMFFEVGIAILKRFLNLFKWQVF
jgi:hypothetical protein